jgi:O-antigen ligase
VLHIRAIAAVHNLYLLLLAETGILGLGAFLVFLIGALGIGIRAICRTTGDWRGICLGLLVGIIGVLGHQMTEFSLWIDSTWYTFAIVVGMLNNIPYLAAAESLRDKSLETTDEIMI